MSNESTKPPDDGVTQNRRQENKDGGSKKSKPLSVLTSAFQALFVLVMSGVLAFLLAEELETLFGDAYKRVYGDVLVVEPLHLWLHLWLLVVVGVLMSVILDRLVTNDEWKLKQRVAVEAAEEVEMELITVANHIQSYIASFEEKTGHEVLSAEVMDGDDARDVVVLKTSLGEKREAITKHIALKFSEDVFGEWTVEGEWKDEAAKKAYVDAKTGS